MSVTLLRTPPADNSGGFMSVRFSQAGRISTIARFHLSAFEGGSYTSPPGSETTVTATFNALKALLGAVYANTWLIELTALTQRSGAGLERVAVPTGSGGVYLSQAGTGLDTTTGIESYVQQILVFNTVGKRKSRIRLVGQGGIDVQGDGPLAANASGTPHEKLVAYLTGSATAIVAHDGTKLMTPVHTTYTTVAGPRRASMRVA